MKDTRTLRDLRSVGPSIEENLNRLGICTVEQLKGKNPQKLYDKLCRLTKTRQDPCVYDVFRCAIAQAENPNLPPEQRDWFFWSKVRKAGK